jgi:hypothetical protein
MGDQIAKSLQERWIALLTLIALSFGGIWLQNQWRQTEQTQKDLLEYTQYVATHYVTKDEMNALISRVSRNEALIDKERRIMLEPR